MALNILAMFLLVAAVLAGAYFSLNTYTHHGEKIVVPNINKKSYNVAKHQLAKLGLEIVIGDTVYMKNLPADIVLEQMPAAGKVVKAGRYVYVMLNAGESPSYNLPDIIDNSSNREAQARLRALGYKYIEVQYIAGEKEWLYGIKSNGKHIKNGDKVSVDARLILQVGDGLRDLGDSITYVDSPFYYEEEEEEIIYRGGYGDDEESFYDQIDENAPIDIDIDAELEMLLQQENATKPQE